jgi:hypothetical protein
LIKSVSEVFVLFITPLRFTTNAESRTTGAMSCGEPGQPYLAQCSSGDPATFHCSGDLIADELTCKRA